MAEPSSIPATAHTVDVADLAALDALAARLAQPAETGDTFLLRGELGAGKTTFARAFIVALARRENAPPPDDVPSPTFTLMQSYDLGRLQVFHFDLFRLKSAEEALELGIDDACADGIALIEWPERLGSSIPADRIEMDLAIVGQGHRRATIRARGRPASRYAEFAQ